MNNDEGIYVLVSPTEKSSDKREYRVAYLDSTGNIVWDLCDTPPDDAVDASKIKLQFDKAKVYRDKMDAQEEVYRISDNLYLTKPPVFHVYMATPYPEWSAAYGQKNQN